MTLTLYCEQYPDGKLRVFVEPPFVVYNLTWEIPVDLFYGEPSEMPTALVRLFINKRTNKIAQSAEIELNDLVELLPRNCSLCVRSGSWYLPV